MSERIRIVIADDHAPTRAGIRAVLEGDGFAVCGEDRGWHWATGELTGKDRVTVWSDEVPAPIAVRYAWADNPRCNLQARSGLPVTPFRTDDFPAITRNEAR